MLGEHRLAGRRGVQVKGDAEIDGEAERLSAILDSEHDAFVASDGDQAAGLTSFLGDLLQIGSGNGNDALAGGDGTYSKIENALGELVAFVFLVTAEVAEFTEGAADAEDRVLREASELDQLGEGAALIGLAEVLHNEEGALQIGYGVFCFG